MQVLKATIITGLAIAASLVGVGGTSSAQAHGSGGVQFKTPNGAAYCLARHDQAYCWTPNDGFTVTMGARDRPTKGYLEFNRGSYPRGYPTLRYGWTWREGRMRCTSRRSGLTCTNASGHGWWLGRYVGYRLF